MKNAIRNNPVSAAMAAAELVVGALLLFRPAAFTKGILIALGLALALGGAASVWRYFRSAPIEAARSQGLARGLGMLAVGLFCVFNSGWFLAAFPLLTMLYGVIMLFSGLYKTQRAVDILRLRMGGALWFGLSAATTLLFALVILLNPFATVSAMWIFIGCMLIGEAVLDAAALVRNR